MKPTMHLLPRMFAGWRAKSTVLTSSCSWRRILSNFHSKVKPPDPKFGTPAPSHTIPLIGFSATFSRSDGLGLGLIFDRIAYFCSFGDMIKGKWHAYTFTSPVKSAD
jgi:superfamily II DNA or RNA helicase